MPCRNLSFLVVEDHAFQRQLLTRLLTTLGAPTVYQAEDGNTAIEVLNDAQRPVDVVISDLAMPGMDGLELVRHLSESCDPVSLILTSAVDCSLLASVANMSRAYGVNLLGVIGKPATAVKLSSLLLRHRAGMRPQAAVQGAPRFAAEEVAQAWKRHEFEPWFEPIADLATEKIVGISTAPRWRHPEHGMLGSESFLSCVHARGLGDALGWMLLGESAAQCRAWHAAGHPLTLYVNIDFGSLTAAGFAARVEETLAPHQLPPASVVLTLSEGALNTDLPKALENLARLRVKGFGLCIEDFGSGLMAVDQLVLVAFTHLKIKSSFVHGDWGEVDFAGIAVGLEVASQLKGASLAAGVVSRHKWDLLRGWGCNFAQGSFVSPPMDAQSVVPWLTNWKP